MFEDKYSFVFDNKKKLLSKYFTTREEATEYMYDVCGKYGLKISKVYDDKHNKTYICSNGYKFFIQRVY